MFLDTVLRQKMHNRWAAARQKHQNDLCAKRRLRSALASAQSDHSLRCSHGETLDPLSVQRRSWSDWVDAQADLSLCKAQMSFCWFCRAPAQDALLLLLLLLLLLQINTAIIAIATAAERKCRCVGFVATLRLSALPSALYFILSRLALWPPHSNSCSLCFP